MQKVATSVNLSAVKTIFERFVLTLPDLVLYSQNVRNSLTIDMRLPKPGENGFGFGVFPTRDCITPQMIDQLKSIHDGACGVTLAIGGTSTVASLVQKQGETYTVVASEKIDTPQGIPSAPIDCSVHYEKVAKHLAQFLTNIKSLLGNTLPSIVISPAGPINENGCNTNTPNITVNYPKEGADSAHCISQIFESINQSRLNIRAYTISDLCALVDGVQLALPNLSQGGEAISICSGTGYGIALAVSAAKLKKYYPNDKAIQIYRDEDVVIINTEDGHRAYNRKKPHILDGLVPCGCGQGDVAHHVETTISGGNISKQVIAIINKLHEKNYVSEEFVHLLSKRIYPGTKEGVPGIGTKQLVNLLSTRKSDYKVEEMSTLFGKVFSNDQIEIVRIIMDNLIQKAARELAASAYAYSEYFFNGEAPLILAGGMFECPEYCDTFKRTYVELAGSFPPSLIGDMLTISMGVIAMRMGQDTLTPA